MAACHHGAKVVTQVTLSVYYYNRAFTDEQWALQLSGTIDSSTDKLAWSFAKTVTKTMMKDGMFGL